MEWGGGEVIGREGPAKGELVIFQNCYFPLFCKRYANFASEKGGKIAYKAMPAKTPAPAGLESEPFGVVSSCLLPVVRHPPLQQGCADLPTPVSPWLFPRCATASGTVCGVLGRTQGGGSNTDIDIDIDIYGSRARRISQFMTGAVDDFPLSPVGHSPPAHRSSYPPRCVLPEGWSPL